MHINSVTTPWRLMLATFALLLTFAVTEVPAQWARPTVVTLEARFEPAEARRGQAVELVLTATVDPKYHLYSMAQPTDQPGPVATQVKLSEDLSASLVPTGDWREPEPKIKFDEGFQMDVGTLYGSPLEFRRAFHIATDIEPGERTFEVKLFYQACTETSCLPPTDAPATATLVVLEGEPVAPPPVVVEPVNPTPDEVKPATTANATEKVVRGSSFVGFLLAAFLLGIVALATPCVFPMIPITITFFTGKASNSTLQASKYAGVYVLSIIAGFTLIGFGFSLLLLAFGAGVERSGFANMIAANPWINFFFAALYIAFALSLFEIFEFRLPTALSSRLNQSAMSSGGYASIFFKALVFVVISFTCTAPLLGVLIVQTLQGSWVRPLFGLMAFSAGFALPFFFLALMPQMLGRLPRAGSWLYATKVIMGLIVLAAAFKFLSNVDLILLRENMLLTREVLLAVWTSIAAVIAFFLFRFIRLKDDGGNEDGIGPMRMMLATVFTVMAIYLASGLFGGQLHIWVESYMPPDLRPNASAVAGNGAKSVNPKDIYTWYDDVEPAMAAARMQGRNVFLDFTGYTCTNCRLMEKDMFPRPEVARLMGEYILVELYTDDPDVGEKWQAYQAQNFNTVALPFYAIVTPDGDVIATEEYTRNEERFVAFLQSGLKSREVASAE